MVTVRWYEQVSSSFSQCGSTPYNQLSPEEIKDYYNREDEDGPTDLKPQDPGHQDASGGDKRDLFSDVLEFLPVDRIVSDIKEGLEHWVDTLGEQVGKPDGLDEASVPDGQGDIGDTGPKDVPQTDADDGGAEPPDAKETDTFVPTCDGTLVPTENLAENVLWMTCYTDETKATMLPLDECIEVLKWEAPDPTAVFVGLETGPKDGTVLENSLGLCLYSPDPFQDIPPECKTPPIKNGDRLEFVAKHPANKQTEWILKQCDTGLASFFIKDDFAPWSEKNCSAGFTYVWLSPEQTLCDIGINHLNYLFGCK